MNFAFLMALWMLAMGVFSLYSGDRGFAMLFLIIHNVWAAADWVSGKFEGIGAKHTRK